MKQLITPEDIKDYCIKKGLEIESLFDTENYLETKEIIETIFHHFTGVRIDKEQFVIDIDSDHNQTYQCSIDLGEEQEEIGSIKSMKELCQRISNMNEAKSKAISNTLNERNFFYSHLSEEIALEFTRIQPNKELKSLGAQREEELRFLSQLHINPDNEIER